MDELAVALRISTRIELRARNEPEVDPESGKPWSGTSPHRMPTRRGSALRLVSGVTHGPRTILSATGLSASGVAVATYPGMAMEGNTARITYIEQGRYTVQIGAADIGTGTWTALTQIAADALDCDCRGSGPADRDTDLPQASVAGGSSGYDLVGFGDSGCGQAVPPRTR